MRVEAKLVAILDRATCIPVVCMRFHDPTEHEARMFCRAGFGANPSDRYTFSYLPNDDWCSYDPHKSPHDYTIGTALVWIRKHWDEVETGTAVDSEFIRGETDTPKKWEDEYNWNTILGGVNASENN